MHKIFSRTPDKGKRRGEGRKDESRESDRVKPCESRESECSIMLEQSKHGNQF